MISYGLDLLDQGVGCTVVLSIFISLRKVDPVFPICNCSSEIGAARWLLFENNERTRWSFHISRFVSIVAKLYNIATNRSLLRSY